MHETPEAFQHPGFGTARTLSRVSAHCQRYFVAAGQAPPRRYFFTTLTFKVAVTLP